MTPDPDTLLADTPEEPRNLPLPLVAERIVRHQHGDGDPQVSVVTLDYHDREDWMLACLRSVREQRDLKAWEHVILDNRENAVGPVGEAKDRAIGFCRAPWVFILDDDDWLADDALAQMLDLGQKGADYVQCKATVVDADGTPWFSSTSTLGLIRKDFYEDTGGFKALNRLSDYEWLTRLGETATRGYVNEPLYFYRLHDAQTSAATKGEMYSLVRERGGVL